MFRFGSLLAVCMGFWLVAAAGAVGPGKDAKIAIDPSLEARAKRMTIEPRDLPAGWLTDRAWNRGAGLREGPTWGCGSHQADLSALVVRAAWSSRNIHVDPRRGAASVVSSDVFVFAKPAQAQVMIAHGVKWIPRYCEKAGMKDGSLTVESVREARLPVPGAIADFRSVETSPLGAAKDVWGDVIEFRRGATWGQLVLSQQGRPFSASLRLLIARKFASRL